MKLRSQSTPWILAAGLLALAPASAAAQERRAPNPDAAQGRQAPASKPASAPAEDVQMTREERAKVVRLLREGERETIAAVEGLTDEQWAFKPAPDKWSVGEVVEHLYLVENRLSGARETLLAGPANPEWRAKTQGKTELLERLLLNREGKVKAPEALSPSGKVPRADVMRGFREARAKTIEFAEKTDRALKEHTLDHPVPVFGTLNGYQWLILVPLHNGRHNLQIAEIKASSGFPAK